jgi:hypothetical protein
VHDDELITVKEACELIGGKGKPVSIATVYRGVKRGTYSPPVHPSPGISRFWKRKLQREIAAATNQHE